ncbi:MAG: flavin-containing monooxygenase [Chloroflexota bacterium]
MKIWDSIVIGAGQSGLAAGYYLQQANASFVILDANPRIGGSWQRYWHSLRLFSPAKYSQLPGMDFPGDPDHFPARDAVIAYLQRYADHFQFLIQTSTRVERVTRPDGIFHIETDQGECFFAHSVVVAGGAFNRPYIPTIPGEDLFNGRVIHSFNYREPSSFAGERVIIVGANNSAVQIGVEIARAPAQATLAVRREINWWPQRFLGKDIFFWFHGTGLDMIPWGLLFDVEDTNMVIDDGRYQTAVAQGQPSVRQMFTRFTPDGVIWPDASAEAVDSIVFATGYRADNMPYLEPLGALCDETGRPHQRGGVSTVVDGLYFIGQFGQRTPASATLRGVGTDARVVVGHLMRTLTKFRTA